MPITPRSVLALAIATFTTLLAAAPTSTSPLAPPPNGPRAAPSTTTVLTHAVVHVSPTQTIDDAVVTIADGRITQVITQADYDARTGLPHPNTRDLAGAHVYAAFIDPWVQVDTPAVDPHSPGAHWSSRITPQRDVLAGPGLTDAQAEKLRKLAVATAAITPKGGILRGAAAVVSTAKQPADPSQHLTTVYRTRAYDTVGYETANWLESAYPTSHMGVIALIRQAILDQQAAATNNPNPDNDDAIAHVPTGVSRPVFWNTSDALEALLADKVWSEFGLDNLVIVGSGADQHRLAALADAHRPVVVPLRFPTKPDIKTVGDAERVSLDDLIAWEQAPANPARLADAGLTVALTTAKLPKGADFFKNLRRAHTQGGLTETQALAMLTTNPAELLGLADQLGTVTTGKRANLAVFSAPFLDDDAELIDLYVDGQRHEINPPDAHAFDGSWRLFVGPADDPFFEMSFTAKGKKITLKEHWQEPDEEPPAVHPARNVTIDPPTISFLADDEDDTETGEPNTYLMTGTLQPDGSILGTALAPDQSSFQWTATPIDEEPDDDTAAADETEPSETKPADTIPPHPGYPFGAYAVQNNDAPRTILLTHATVWTQGPEGTLEDANVLIHEGKVVSVWADADTQTPDVDPEALDTTVTIPNAGTVILGGNRVIEGYDVDLEIDCTGLHITPGIIDCHSHTGLFRFGVNEAGQAVTAECRIGDSLDPGHINWYRELAGGVTTANLLHGSANPIGGQSQTVKLRWGAHRPEDMFFVGAKPGIKFALGENVKQSNWGDDHTTRYPQTRLGVETLMRDRFTAAREYAARGMKTADGRTDLELQALAQVLDGDRLVHCHSYRQDEILMLCRVAEDFGFKLGTFQHGLETYKVAEVVKEHAIGASMFSDWWAYKVEVQDANPYAGPINFAVGLLSSYNSDSDELARRLNLEAAKALKYANQAGIKMTPQDALAFVTINPAVQLGIDDRVGSLEPGKDADIVVWSADPLSSFSKPVRVFVDGVQRFSLEQDAAIRQHTRAERARLIAKLIAAPDRPEDKAKDHGTPAEDHDHLAHGFLPGDCGCETLPAAYKEIQ